MSLIIGIDNISPGGSTSAGTLGGMRAYLDDLVEFLPPLRTAYTFKLFTPGHFSPSNAGKNMQVVSCLRVPENRFGRVLYEQVKLPQIIRKEQVDLWLGICNTIPLISPCASVVIVQSMQYLSFPHSYSLPQRVYLRAFGEASAKRSNKIIALSKASKDMICSSFKVPASKVVVAHNGLSRALSEPSAAGLKASEEHVHRFTRNRPYALSVSSFYQYKNLPRLISAFARICRDVPQQLVIVGGETATVRAESLSALASRLGISDRVIFAGQVSHEGVAAFYKHADALLMPSLEETFGLPVLEAMAFGCPVVTSNIGSMAEIAGAAAQLVNPLDTDSIASGMKAVLADAGCRDSLRDMGRKRARRFMNNRSTDLIASVIDSVLLSN